MFDEMSFFWGGGEGVPLSRFLFISSFSGRVGVSGGRRVRGFYFCVCPCFIYFLLFFNFDMYMLCINLYVQMRMYAYTYTYACSRVRSHISLYKYKHAHMQKCICEQLCAHAHIREYISKIHTQEHIKNIYTHKYIHVNARSCIYIYIFGHTSAGHMYDLRLMKPTVGRRQ